MQVVFVLTSSYKSESEQILFLLSVISSFSLGPSPYFLRNLVHSQTKPEHVFPFFFSHLKN